MPLLLSLIDIFLHKRGKEQRGHSCLSDGRNYNGFDTKESETNTEMTAYILVCLNEINII